jgi:hypothetical protein
LYKSDKSRGQGMASVKANDAAAIIHDETV